MLRNPRTSRPFVLVAGAALAAAGLPLLTGAPAQATTLLPLIYHCTTDPNVGTYDVTAVVDTNAPATLGAGLSVPITVTSDVTIPETLATYLRDTAHVASVDGTSEATGTVDGVSRKSTLTIARTPVPVAGTPMHLVGTGPGGSITAGAVGSTILIGAGDFTATLNGYDTAGTKILGPVVFTCALTPPTGQNLLVDSVSVVQTPTTTTLTVTSPVEYGAPVSASVTVSRAGTNAKPAGTVAFTYAGTTVTVVVKGGKASAEFPAALTMGTNQVTAVFTPTDKTVAPSSATTAFTVVKGSTTTTASAVYRDATNRLVAKALVEAVHGTEVAGDVKFVLKRNGTKIRSAIVALNVKDKAKKVFKNISKAGTYVVVAKYLGSPTLKRSKDRAKVII